MSSENTQIEVHNGEVTEVFREEMIPLLSEIIYAGVCQIEKDSGVGYSTLGE